MATTTELAFVFGSRAGTCLALALFGTVFALLAVAILRALPARSDAAARRRRLVAAIAVTGALAAVHFSSFRGFHELVVGDDRRLRLEYLLPFEAAVVATAEVAEVRPAPWYRGQWRLQVTTVDHRTFESAPSARDVVHAAADRLRPPWRGARPLEPDANRR